MTTTEINYNEAFNLFIGNDDYRPELMHPYKQNGKYYATDAHSMIFLPCEEVELNFVEQDKPKSEAVVPRDDMHNLNVSITISELEEKLIPEMIDEEIEKTETKKCSECDGEGKVEFEYSGNKRTYTIEEDCPECDGSGNIEREFMQKTGKKVANPMKKFQMHEVGFMYKELRRLVDVARVLGEETVVKKFGTATQANLFKCGKATILIMPVVSTDWDNSEFTLIF